MPSVGTELCGQVSFGGDPPWGDAEAIASGSAKGVSSGLQRIPLASSAVSAVCRITVMFQRCTQHSAVAQGRADRAGRFVHLVSVTGRTGGSTKSGSMIQRIVQLDGAAIAWAGEASALRRIVQHAVTVLGNGVAEGLLQRCPQLNSCVAGMARAWFVPITVMGRADRTGKLCRLAQHTLDARVLSAQDSRCVRLCQVQAPARGGNTASAQASLLVALPISCVAGADACGRITGTWTIQAAGKAQSLATLCPVTLVPLHSSPCAGGAESFAKVHRLVDGIGPELSFAAPHERVGGILFEVER